MFFRGSASCCGFWVSRPSTRLGLRRVLGQGLLLDGAGGPVHRLRGPHGEERAEPPATVLNICLGAGLAGVVLADYANKVGEEKDAWRNEIMLERSLAAAGHEQHKLRKRVRLAKRMIKELKHLPQK